ncbi:MAG: hypothetical protein ACLF0G_11775 [Candidatus Brocadiia bacterium]
MADDDELREKFLAPDQDASRPVSMPQYVAESLEHKGRHVAFTKEMSGWHVAEASPQRILFRPGWDAGKALVGTAALAAGLSVVFYLAGARGSAAWYILHVPLWLIAVSWPASLLYQKLELRKDAANGLVRVRGQGVVFPFRRRFPIGEVALHLARTEHRTSAGGTASHHVGWDWKLMVLAQPPLALLVGHTPGREPPGKPPLEVRRTLAAFCEMFEVPVQMAFPYEE